MRRPMGLGKKPPVYDDSCMTWLMRMSKAALADCVVDLLRGASGSCDMPVSEGAAIGRLSAVLALRGDKIPDGEAERISKRVNKRRAQRIFDTACKIAEEDRHGRTS